MHLTFTWLPLAAREWSFTSAFRYLHFAVPALRAARKSYKMQCATASATPPVGVCAFPHWGGGRLMPDKDAFQLAVAILYSM